MKPIMDKEIIYYNSAKAAQPAKLILADGTEKALWVASNGAVFPDEHTARYTGCTHSQCDCGSWKQKHRTKCEKCIEKNRQQTFHSKSAFPYKGEPVCLYLSDTYFWSMDDIQDYCHEHGVKKEDLQLIHCEPIKPNELDWDYFSDAIPDEGDEDVFSKEMIEAVEKLNEVIRNHKPTAWTEGKFRVSFEKEVANG
jgi:hypothetical protein